MYYEKFCKNCSNETHCCIFNHDAGFTFVSVNDAYKIAKDTGKNFGEFLDYSTLSKKSLDALKRDDEMYEGALRLSLLDSHNRILRLKKKEDGKCVFLSDKGKCTIYGARPNVCRIYPFWAMRLLSGEIKVLSHDITPRCPIVVSLVKNAHDRDVEKLLSSSQIKSIKETFSIIEKEAEEYKRDITSFVKLL